MNSATIQNIKGVAFNQINIATVYCIVKLPLQSFQIVSFVHHYSLVQDSQVARCWSIAKSHIDHLARILEFGYEGKYTESLHDGELWVMCIANG